MHDHTETLTEHVAANTTVNPARRETAGTGSADGLSAEVDPYSACIHTADVAQPAKPPTGPPEPRRAQRLCRA
jgi:hypothetical protein